MVHGLFIFTLLLSIVYAIFLFWCVAGWLQLPKVETNTWKNSMPVFVSVIVPARNEEENIYSCLSDFIHQDFPFDSFEVIVVDDHSTDRTAEIVAKFKLDHPALRMQLLLLKDEDEKKTYKKHAITAAIAISSAELILTTDADCRRGKQWISTVAAYYETCRPEMISAPVIFESEKSWLEKIQSLEFLGLIAIGAAAIRNGHPFLCNGANLAFSNEAFVSAGGYASSKNISSGDDTQLMRKIANRGKDRIHFLKSMNATVTTHAQTSMRELLNQRKRWASKIPSQMNSFTLFIAVIAYFLHAGLFLSGLLMFYTGNSGAFFIPLIIKIIPEFILLACVSVFFKKSKLLFLFLPAQVIYPVYISVVGIISLSGSYQWKGREVK